VALCAQLPDEAAELSAIDVYKRLMRHPASYAAWALRGRGSPATVGRMAAVQQLQHGLTGGSAEGVTTVAQRVVSDALAELERAPKPGEERTDRLCALGLALHLYGDAFSHRRIKNPALMYPTGVGHLFDRTLPDLPLISPQRHALWSGYVRSAVALMPAGRAEAVEPMLSRCEPALRSAKGGNGFNEQALRVLLADWLKAAGVVTPFLPFDEKLRKAGCQALAARQAAAYGLDQTPSCERAWALFSGWSRREFQDYDADPARAAAPSRSRPVPPYYSGSPFDKGPEW
jgi:hypothetical protein